MLSYNEAFELIREEFRKFPLKTENVSIVDALYRTVAEEIKADVNLPPFDNSAIDGIAVKFNENIRNWRLIGEISAGNFKEYDFDENSAVAIMTGAQLPRGCNTAVPLEDYKIEGDRVKLLKGAKFKRGMNIRRKASDVAAGETVIESGSFLTPNKLAAIAACGAGELSVLKKMKFAILATGDELVPLEQKPEGDKLRTSNNYALTAAAQMLFQEAHNYGFINDNYNAARDKIEKMLESDADIVLTTGGVSVGKYDFVKEIFQELGVTEIFWRAYIKPGKPAFFGKYEKEGNIKLVFGLPGNPVSCLVNFYVYIKPNIIEKYNMPEVVRIKAKLTNDLRKKDAKRHFVRGFLKRKGDEYFVSSTGSHSSGNLAGFASANCLIELYEEMRNPQKGDSVECIMM